MITIDRSLQLELVAEAGRAPSAHNAQPARWRFTDDGFVELHEDATRRLAIGDPNGRDHAISLGAAVEGMAIALSRRGITLASTHPASGCVARFALRNGATRDPLEAWTSIRHTWRGRFVVASAQATSTLRSLLQGCGDVQAVFDAATIATLADLNDRAAAATLANEDYQRELFGWMRFSPRDSRWHRDGLTSECLGLSQLERVGARYLMEPSRFAALARRGWHAPLVAEAARTRSAAALAVFHRSSTESGLDSGRRFYRFWLELTRAGFAARPMSALVDAPEAMAEVRRRSAVPVGQSVINVFAIGVAPEREPARSPRLPAAELLAG